MPADSDIVDALYMQALINARPEATTALLMQLCTEGGDASKADGDWVAKVADFAHLYAERCAATCSNPSCLHVIEH